MKDKKQSLGKGLNTNVRGFALVVTIAILSLVVMIALAMVSLSQVTTRSSVHSGALEEARANARVALAMAVNRLQQLSGLDTRITAPANIFIEDSPPLTGVWKSWEGTNHDSSGRPISPDYGVKRLPSSDTGSRFLGFLVSGADSILDPVNADFSDIISSSASTDNVPLLGEGSLAQNPGQVHVKPLLIGNGGYAWWVSPENQKARLIHPHEPESNDAAGWAKIAKSHAVPDVREFGLGQLENDLEKFDHSSSHGKVVSKVLSRRTMSLLGSSNSIAPSDNFHDFSQNAVGLLTNVATGGWKKDLSILSERWENIYQVSSKNSLGFPQSVDSKVSLPLFRYAPETGQTSSVPLPLADNLELQNNYAIEGSNLYPWATYTQLSANKKLPFTYSAASSSWQSLVNFLTYYKKVDYDESLGLARGPLGWKYEINQPRRKQIDYVNQRYYGYYHDVELNPILARVQFIVQVQAVKDPTVPEVEQDENYRVNTRLLPVVTLWNPYNIAISKSLVGNEYQQGLDQDFGVGTQRSLPVAMGIINGTVPPSSGFAGQHRLINEGGSRGLDGTHRTVDAKISENKKIFGGANKAFFRNMLVVSGFLPLEWELQPGEVKIFTPRFNRRSNTGSSNVGVRLKEGFEVGDDKGIAVVLEEDDGSLKNPGALHKVVGRDNEKLLLSDQLRFSLRSDRFTRMYKKDIAPIPGGGAFFGVGTPEYPLDPARIADGYVPKAGNYYRSLITVNPDMDWNKVYWPNDELAEVQYAVSDLVPGNGNPKWTNIFSISAGPRLTLGAGHGNPANRPNKGMVQNSPFVTHSFSLPEKASRYHPVNNPFEMSYSTMSLNSDLSPEIGTAGYIATGFQSGEGLSRLVMTEYPITPVVSLGELQNWNVRGTNPLPPFQYNLIGNSDATPFVRKDSVLPEEMLNSEASINLQHDDAYCANHLLFDDWLNVRHTSF